VGVGEAAGGLGGTGLQIRTPLGTVQVGTAPTALATGAGGDEGRQDAARRDRQLAAGPQDRREDPTAPLTPVVTEVGGMVRDRVSEGVEHMVNGHRGRRHPR
jgi:hypothetical protein